MHNSLLADYYPAMNRPARLRRPHQRALSRRPSSGPPSPARSGACSAGGPPFMVLIVPILITTYFVRRLEEPVRGATDDPASALSIAAAAGSGFGSVRACACCGRCGRCGASSLRRCSPGAGLIPLAFYVPLYLERVYHLGPVPARAHRGGECWVHIPRDPAIGQVDGALVRQGNGRTAQAIGVLRHGRRRRAQLVRRRALPGRCRSPSGSPSTM